jgi:hypothetical protein
MTTLPAPVREAHRDIRRRRQRAVALVAVTGLGVGAATSLGQTYLDGALNAVVNSASAWLVAPFLVGRVMATRAGAAAAGLSVCLLQLAGYYATAHLRGFPAGGGIVVFWVICGLVGGPVFGAAGHVWRTGARDVRGLGATLLPAAFLAEGGWLYARELHYLATAAVWILIGFALTLMLPRGLIERRWLVVTLALGIVGEVALGHAYRHAVSVI